MLSCEESAELLFCDNETNNQRLFGAPNVRPYVKDGINDYVVSGATDAVNPAHTGTKAAALHKLELRAGRRARRIRVRLTAASAGSVAEHVAASRSAPASTACWRRGDKRPTSSTPR